MYVHPQVRGKGMKIIQHGFSCALENQPIMATLLFSVWPDGDFQWIGAHLDVLKDYPKAYEEAVKQSDHPWLKSGIENLL